MTTSFTPATVLPSFEMMSGAQVVVLTPDNGVVHIPGHDVLATSMFGHAGHNLVISDPEGVTYVIKGFFTVDHPPSLTDASGAVVDGSHAAQYAGPANVGVYAQAGGKTAGPQIGQIRTLTGEGKVTHADGTVVPLKVGTPLFADDVVTTNAGASAAVVLIDGTTLAMDAKAEIVLDELIYDPATHGGTEKVSLVHGAASFVSGQIAKSGQDHMVFKTPVATIGIRGTKVFAQFNPDTGEITILNRPVADASGNMGVGKIALFMPDGTFAGEITTANSAWQFNPSKGEGPQQVQLSEAQVQGIAGNVDRIVNSVAAQVHQEQQQNNGTLNMDSKGQGNDKGGDNKGGDNKGGDNKGGDNKGGDNKGGDSKGGDSKGSDSKSDSGDTQTTKVIVSKPSAGFSATGSSGDANGSGNSSTSQNNNSSTTSFTPTNSSSSSAPPGTSNSNTQTQAQQPVIQATQVTVSDNGATHARPGSVTFTVTRVNNLDQTTVVNYSTKDGDAHAGTDYTGASGSLTFNKGDTTASVTIPILIGNRATTVDPEFFTFAISGGAGVAGGAFVVAVIAPPPPLPTVTIGDAVVTDLAAGTATLTLTRTGDTTLPSTIKYATTEGTGTGAAKGGDDFGITSGSVTFAINQKIATITIPIFANSKPLTFLNQEPTETFQVTLSAPDGAKLGNVATGTVTITADPVVGQASFSISSTTTNHGTGNFAVITITRSGDQVGQVSVSYGTKDGNAVDGRDYSGVSGKVTFDGTANAANPSTTKTITIPIIASNGTTPEEHFTVGLSNATNGSTISQGTGTISIAAHTTPTVSISGATVSDAVAGFATVTVSLSAASAEKITVAYATSGGNAGVDYTPASGSVTFNPGETSHDISIQIPAQPTKTTTTTFSVVLTSATNATIGSDSATVTIGGNTPPPVGPNLHAPTGPTSAILTPSDPANPNPSGMTVAALFAGLFKDLDAGDTLSGIAIGANNVDPNSQGLWQYSSDNGTTWRTIPSGMSISFASPLVVSSTSLIRFLPVGGFFGTPNGIVANVMDSSYAGGFSDSTTNGLQVMPSNPPSGGTSFLSNSFTQIDTAVLTADSISSGNWTDPGAWTLGAVPNAGQLASLGGSVSLSSGTSNSIAYLRMLASSSLSISASSVLSTSLGGNIATGATLTVSSGALSSDGGLYNSGTIALTGGALQGLGAVVNFGAITVTGANSILGLETINVGTLTFSSTASITAPITNYLGITVAAGAAASFSAPVTNNGIFNYTGGNLNFGGNGAFTNQVGGTLNASASGGTLSGNLNNLQGTINITANTTFQGGSLINGDNGGSSTLSIAAGTVLTVAPGARIVQNNTNGTYVGAGTNGPNNASIKISDGAEFKFDATGTIPAGLVVSVGTPAGTGGLVTGSTVAVSGALALGAGTVSAPVTVNPGGGFSITGQNSTISGNVMVQPGATPGVITVVGTATTDANVLFTGTLDNFGRIVLSSSALVANGPVPATNIIFDVSHSTFTNEAGALLLSSAGGSSPGQGGGDREIVGAFTNHGVFSITTDTTYRGGTLTNDGGVNLGTGQTLTIAPGAELVDAGGTYTGTNTNSGTLSTIQLAHDAEFYVGGNSTKIGAGLRLVVGDENGAASVGHGNPTDTLSIEGQLVLVDGTTNVPVINVKPGGTLTALNNHLVTITGEINIGDSTHPGGTLMITGAANDAYVNIVVGGTGFRNYGTIRLTDSPATQNGPVVPRDVTLEITGPYTLGNYAGGSIIISAGPTGGGGARTIIGIIDNGSYDESDDATHFATLDVQTDTVFSSGMADAIRNHAYAVFKVEAGATADFLDAGFTNDAHGIMTINGAMNMHGGTLQNDGTINGSGTITLGTGGHFMNTGSSSISPGNSPGQLTIDGSATFGAGTHTNIQLAGAAAGQFDVLSVNEHFALGGALDVQSYNGFAPQAGDSFHVMNWGSASGTFDSATGLVFGNVALDPILNDTGLTLTARMITQQAGAGDVTLTGGSHDNVLVGGGGNDTLIAGPGNDLLIGGKGDTTFMPGAGNDHIVGGSGINTVDFGQQSGPVTADLSQGSATTSAGGHDTLIGIQNIIGTSAADTLTGDAHDNVITGGAGADTLAGGAGHNTFQYNGTADGGDTLKDFTSGKDIFGLLQSAFGLGTSVTAGQNFSVIEQAFNGTSAGANAAFDAANPTLVYSTHDDALYYDPHGAGPGYTLIAHVEPGTVVTANDIHLFQSATA